MSFKEFNKLNKQNTNNTNNNTNTTDAAASSRALVEQVMSFLRDAMTFGSNELSPDALLRRYGAEADGGLPWEASRDIGFDASVTYTIRDSRLSLT